MYSFSRLINIRLRPNRSPRGAMMAPPTGPRHIAGSENAVGLQLPQPVRRVGREEQPA